MSVLASPLQVPGGPELLVLALILLPLAVLALIGLVLVRRLLDLPDPSRVNELEREVQGLRERVEDVEDDRRGRGQRGDGQRPDDSGDVGDAVGGVGETRDGTFDDRPDDAGDRE